MRFFLFLVLCSIAQASLPGFYFSAGLGAGWSDADQDSFTTLTGSSTTYGISNAIETGGVSANAAIGYSFPYLALEARYTYAPDFTENDTGQVNFNGAFAGFLNSNAKSSLNYVSTLGILAIPIYRFDLTIGSGLAIVFKHTQKRKSLVLFDGSVISSTTQPSENHTFYQPEIVAGISKDWTNHWTSKVLYTRVFGKSHIGIADAARHFLPNINTLTLVVSYTL